MIFFPSGPKTLLVFIFFWEIQFIISNSSMPSLHEIFDNPSVCLAVWEFLSLREMALAPKPSAWLQERDGILVWSGQNRPKGISRLIIGEQILSHTTVAWGNSVKFPHALQVHNARMNYTYFVFPLTQVLIVLFKLLFLPLV